MKMLNSIHDIKKELQQLPDKRLIEIVSTLARYKKDNKEYLNYLLYYADSNDAYINAIIEEVDTQFAAIDVKANLYFVKKSLRKILRIITRYSRYIDDKQVTTRLLIYFCRNLKESGIPFENSKMIMNMYQQQLKKINTMIDGLHEDLRHDFKRDIETLI